MQSFPRLIHGNALKPISSRLPYDNSQSKACIASAIDILYAGIPAEPDTYASLLQACGDMKALVEGKQIHAHLLINGVEDNISVGDKLVNMYVNCGSLAYARLVFDRMPKRNLFAWNWMIGGYATNGFSEKAIQIYCQMQQSGVQPNKFTFPCVLKACGGFAGLQQGREVHERIIRSGFESDIYVGNALIDMYAKCGNMKDAGQVFDRMPKRDVASWTAMIAGCAKSGNCDDAFDLFRKMESADIKPNEITWTAMIAGYVQNGLCEAALKLFVEMKQAGMKPNVAAWNAMIAGYTQNGNCDEALKLFYQMQGEGFKPNGVTIASILPGCANAAALELGKQIHDFIFRNGLESNVFVENALIDMYAKCGSAEDASQVFDKMPQRTIVSWNAMITCYGLHGDGQSAVILFEKMQQAGIKPNHVTFTCLLSACSHAGLVEEGCHYFNSMTGDYNVAWDMEHYACMVDLLGRAGRVAEAYEFIRHMPLEPSDSVWGALLGACRIHCNMDLADCVAESLFELKPHNAGIYVLLSNVYAAAGRWDDVATVRQFIIDRGLKKKPGCSWIVIKNKVHAFLVGDRSHPETEEIFAMLENLARQMEVAGYVPKTNFVLYDVEMEEKEYILCGHSERLAIAYGLMHTFPGTPIQITKNLRVCGDCHTVTKFISKIAGRKVIVRDGKRFHHFTNGLCSCGDYW